MWAECQWTVVPVRSFVLSMWSFAVNAFLCVCVRERDWWPRQTIYPVLNRPDEHWMNEWSARPQYIMCSKCSFIKASDVPSTNLPTLLNLFQTWNKLLFLIFMKPTLAEIFVKPMRVGDSVIKFLCDVSNRLSSNCQERKMSMEG